MGELKDARKPPNSNGKANWRDTMLKDTCICTHQERYHAHHDKKCRVCGCTKFVKENK